MPFYPFRLLFFSFLINFLIINNIYVTNLVGMNLNIFGLKFFPFFYIYIIIIIIIIIINFNMFNTIIHHDDLLLALSVWLCPLTFNYI